MELSRSFICKALFSLAATALISVSSTALAEDQIEQRHVLPAKADLRFLVESDLAISKMSLGMTVEATGDADRDFVVMMSAHEQGAVDVARAEVKYGHNQELRRLAGDMIAAREHEVLLMHDAVGRQSPPQGDAPHGNLTSGQAPTTKNQGR
jgi:hypothetical protein